MPCGKMLQDKISCNRERGNVPLFNRQSGEIFQIGYQLYRRYYLKSYVASNASLKHSAREILVFVLLRLKTHIFCRSTLMFSNPKTGFLTL